MGHSSYIQSQDSFRAFGLVLCLVAFIIYCNYVFRNSYRIVLDGLWKHYVIWVLQLDYLFLFLLICFIRPMWKREQSDWIWNSQNLCHVIGKVWAFLLLTSNVFVTLFSYFKAVLYFKFVMKDTPCLLQLFRFCTYGYVISVLVSIIFLPTGPYLDNDYQVCIDTTGTRIRRFYTFNTFMYLLLNGTMCTIFWYYSDMESDLFRDLDYQLKINRNIIPIMFISTLILSIPGLIFSTSGMERESLLPLLSVICQFTDNFINNIVMYYSLFCSPNDDAQLEELNARYEFMLEQKSKELDEDMIVQVDEIMGDTFFWVSLPGLHPINVSKHAIDEYNLEEYVVADKKLLRQIERYKKHGVISSLSCVCRSRDDLDFAISAMRKRPFEHELESSSQSSSHMHDTTYIINNPDHFCAE